MAHESSPVHYDFLLASKQQKQIGSDIHQVDNDNVRQPDWWWMFVDTIFFHLCVTKHVVGKASNIVVVMETVVERHKAAPTKHPQEDSQEEKQVLVVLH